MAKTLEIAGENYLPYIKTSTAKIREMLRKTNVMNLQIVTKGIADAPQGNAEVVYKDGSRFLFGGYITNVEPAETGKGELFVYDVECSSYDYIFNNKIARRGYQNKTLKYIVEDLLSEYLSDDYGFDTTNVQTGPTIATVAFDHISLRKCFEKLSKLTGYVWYVDYEKKIFFQTQTSEPAPEAIRDDLANMESVSISRDPSQVRNSVIVIGSTDGVQSLDAIVQTIEGDGETRSWVLDEKPSEIDYIKINGATQQFSLDVNERESDVFVYNFESKSLRLTQAQTTPVGGGTPDEIEIRYFPRIPIIEQLSDNESIAIIKALDGGDGVYEYTIKESTITSLEEAGARARQELDNFAMPLIVGKAVTRTGLLTGGSIFKPGQYITVNLPSYGLSTDTVFLIQGVDIEVIEGSATEYRYTIQFGGKVVGVQEFLETLAAQQAEGETAENVDQILTIKHTADLMLFEDDVQGEVASPPYKYSPGTPLGRYNMAMWG